MTQLLAEVSKGQERDALNLQLIESNHLLNSEGGSTDQEGEDSTMAVRRKMSRRMGTSGNGFLTFKVDPRIGISSAELCSSLSSSSGDSEES